MKNKILNLDNYLKSLKEQYFDKISEIKKKIDSNIDDLIKNYSEFEIIDLIKKSKHLELNQINELINKFHNKNLTKFDWILIIRESLVIDKKIEEIEEFNEIINYFETGAITLATQNLQDFSIKLVEELAKNNPNSVIKIDGTERIIEIPEDFYKETINEFRKRLTKITLESTRILTNELLEVYSNDSSFQKKSLKQLDYKQPNYLDIFTGKTATMLFRTDYSELDTSKPIKHGVIVSKKTKNKYINIIEVNAKCQNLDELDLEIVEAFYTERKANPEAQAISFLDLANDIYRSKTGNKLNTRDKFVQEVERRCRLLTHTPVYMDFNPEIDFILENSKDEEIKAAFQRYRDNGGSGKPETNFILGSVVAIKKANGIECDGIKFVPSSTDEVFFSYIEMTKGLKRIPELLLLNPLQATKENAVLHNYLAGKLMQLPYNSNQPKLINTKLKLLKSEESASNLKTSEIYKEALVFQKSIPKKDLTIRLDTLKKDLKLKTSNSRITRKLDAIFDDWISEGFINNYNKNYTKNNRSIESYTIYIF